MKKIIKIIIGLLFISYIAFGQSIRIHTKNGTDAYNLADIDSITFDVSGSVSSTVKDIDGNVYNTVQIGNQVWMVENLKVTHFRNGEPLLNGSMTTEPAYINYNNDSNNVQTYGRLYNWYAISDSRNIAPEGWHVATDEDWKEMEMFLGMSQIDADTTGWRDDQVGGKLKEIGTTHWQDPNTAATNESGFTAVPGGWCTNYSGEFATMGKQCFFWMPEEIDNDMALHRRVVWSNGGVYRFSDNKKSGFSVRCVKD